MSTKSEGQEIISVYRGYGLILELAVQRNCAKVNLADAQLHLQVHDAKHLLFKMHSKEVSDEGIATIILYPWQTDLPCGDYFMNIKLVESDGNSNTIFPSQIDNAGILRVIDS